MLDSEKGALKQEGMQKLCKLCSVLYYFITFASAPHRINKELHRWVIKNAYVQWINALPLLQRDLLERDDVKSAGRRKVLVVLNTFAKWNQRRALRLALALQIP
jgi:hypothetical protein